MNFRNWTPFVFMWPHRYVDNHPRWERVDVDEWSHKYTWLQDPLDGLIDIATPPGETWDREWGDCEDYALVVASVLISRGRTDVGLAFCLDVMPPKGHVVAYDSERVYSSGRIYSKSIQDYATKWDVCIPRPILTRRS